MSSFTLCGFPVFFLSGPAEYLYRRTTTLLCVRCHLYQSEHTDFSNLECQYILVSVSIEHVVTEHSGVGILKWNSCTLFDEDVLESSYYIWEFSKNIYNPIELICLYMVMDFYIIRAVLYTIICSNYQMLKRQELFCQNFADPV